MTIMHLNGYDASIDYDPDADIFHGEVINLKDVITFQGTSTSELKQAFADSLEDYFAFCKERGEEPDKPFSGQFLVRVEPHLHKLAALAARKSGLSLNKWIAKALERAVG